MKSYESKLSIVLLIGVSTCLSSGCSLLFVKAPPAAVPQLDAAPTEDCTSSRAAPILDTIFAGLEAARTGVALAVDDSVYDSPNQPLSRGADVALGVGFTALFLGSAIYGYLTTARCDRAQRGEIEPAPQRTQASESAPAVGNSDTQP